MESIVKWLKDLEQLDAATLPEGIRETFANLSLPGHVPLDLNEWVMATSHYVPATTPSGLPGCSGLLRFFDVPGHAGAYHHRLIAEFASAFSLATGRFADMQYQLPVRVEGQPFLYFLPWTRLAERSSIGPLPNDAGQKVEHFFSQLRGLSDDDQRVIGAAATLYHGALLLVGSDLRAAYTLLVAGAEVLSRSYGQPPTDWVSWDQHEAWDRFISSSNLSEEQASALRDRLMEDRQVRLKRTFETYAATRLPDAWWDSEIVEWEYTPELGRGQTKYNGPTVHATHLVRDLIPEDRLALRCALGRSYNLRSDFVHSGAWFGLMEMLPGLGGLPIDPAKPLPFGLLSILLRHLLLFEIEQHATPKPLPDVKLTRPPDDPLVRRSSPAAPSISVQSQPRHVNPTPRGPMRRKGMRR